MPVCCHVQMCHSWWALEYIACYVGMRHILPPTRSSVRLCWGTYLQTKLTPVCALDYAVSQKQHAGPKRKPKLCMQTHDKPDIARCRLCARDKLCCLKKAACMTKVQAKFCMQIHDKPDPVRCRDPPQTLAGWRRCEHQGGSGCGLGCQPAAAERTCPRLARSWPPLLAARSAGCAPAAAVRTQPFVRCLDLCHGTGMGSIAACVIEISNFEECHSCSSKLLP